MLPESIALLWEVREAGTKIAEFIRGLDEESFRRDELRRSAVERQLEIAGEALNNLRRQDPVGAPLSATSTARSRVHAPCCSGVGSGMSAPATSMSRMTLPVF